ncbi:hypothetical protein GCM10011360_36820 [Primorskyibacter flagellatus]|uniref:MmgE/PrpD family protein n=1 Tax=Primorskyibacter flagellatus TaxID=1387277 RepID=A0A917AEV4_9RHOB|nr:MmgE/PrpD family protein [Primorskyibacter flagellatus]GGE46170.1 hypothetical protein GCM10011360_36820 [Primorskyibacter flagellatus]
MKDTETAAATRKIARFIAENPDFGSDDTCRLLARRALLDTMACAIGGSGEPASRAALTLATEGPQGRARVWATGHRATTELAAFANGVSGHVLDFDDVTAPMRGHPSIALLPALIAVAEERVLTMDRVDRAYAVGFELICRFSHAAADGHYARGWHTTPTIGGLGAVAALAHLLGLSETQTRHAFGLALTQLAGTRGNFGSMAKSVQAGQASRAALFAVRLAELGFDAADDSLDGDQGFLTLYTNESGFGDHLEGLGTGEPELLRSGIEVKKYPLCYATHRAVDGLLDLMKETPGLTLASVVSARIHGSPRAFVPLIHSRPRTGLEGKFSMEYAVAAALSDGEITLASFTDDRVQRPEVQAAFDRITVSADTEGSLLPRWTDISLTLADGRILTKRVEVLRGSADHPLTEAELMAKVADCCRHAGGRIDPEKLGRTILDSTDLRVSDLLDSVLPRG